jgi:hypothetical protein
MAYQEKTEARLKEEPGSVDMTPELAHRQEILMEDSVFSRSENRGNGVETNDIWPHSDARRRKRSGTRAKIDAESLVAVRRGTTRRTTVSWRKMNIFGNFWKQRNCGLRKEVTAAGIKVNRRSGVARRKNNFLRKYPTRDIVEQAIPKRRTEGNKNCNGPGCKNGIRD